VTRAAAYVRSLDPELPGSIWTLELGTFVNFFGSGIAFPYLAIYLHNVRGFGLGTAGLVLATNGLVAVAAGPTVGPLIDRFGGRVTLGTALVVSAAGWGLMALVREPWHAFLLAGVAGIGTGVFWPSVSVLLVGLTPAAKRHTAFAVQRVALNLGIGLGGLVGGLIATSSDPGSFTVLFVVDGATFLAMIFVLPFVGEPEVEVDAEPQAGGYRRVVRDRVFVTLLGLNVLFIAAGYAVFELLPVFAKNHNGVSERWIGMIFFFNTMALVVAQMPVARLVEGRRRLKMLAVMPAAFTICWLVVLAGGAWADGTAAALVFVLAAVGFGLASCFHGPTQAALVADLAPARLRGRYMALSSMSWEVGFVLGPAVGGFVLAAQPLALWPLAAGVLAASIVLVLRTERRLPPPLRITPKQ
jgi:predicted MFS family arabinose efflux permease